MNTSLNVGCGNEKLFFFDTIDFDQKFEPTILHNLNNIPWPIDNERYKYVRAYHVIEHMINPLDFVKEVYRILQSNGLFEIQVPDKSCKHSYLDWSHLHTQWDKEKMKWLENPTNYVNGFSFKMVNCTKDSFFKDFTKWWIWRDRFKGLRPINLTALFQKA